MSDAKILKYRNKRTVLELQLERIDNFCKTLENASICELQTRFDALNKCFELFLIIQENLEELDDTELISHNRAKFEETFFKIKPCLMVAITKLQNEEKCAVPTQKQPKFDEEANSLKLVKLSMPTFSGNPLEWTTFFEAFTSLVINNKQLDDVSRFHYLRLALEKPALNRIDGLDTTAANYPKALELLKKRYGSKKLIAQEHIKILFNLPHVEKNSSTSLRALIDTTTNNLQALATLGRPSAQWDDLIVHLVLSHLDPANRDKWEDESPTDRLCTLEELFKFLERRCSAMESICQFNSSSKTNQSSTSYIKPLSQKPPKQSSFVTSQKFIPKSTPFYKKCVICLMTNHYIYRCNRFHMMPPNDRLEAINRLKLCVNCLRDSHVSENCLSTSTCSECTQKHHSLLHYAFAKTTSLQSSITNNYPTNNVSQKASGSRNSTTLLSNSTLAMTENTLEISKSQRKPSQSYVLLATAVIKVLDVNGSHVNCRVLLDSCSTRHYISNKFATQLGLPRHPYHSSFSGIGDVVSTSNEWMNINISSRTNSFSIDLEAHILPKITTPLPHQFIDIRSWPIPKHVQLADETFSSPQRIDLLIGAELYYQIITQQQIALNDNLPMLQNTVFGWIVSGKIDSNTTAEHLCSVAVNESSKLDYQLQKFWEIERHDEPTKNLSPEEEACESLFLETTTRDASGRFIVRLPFKTDPDRLGSSYNSALKRFYNIERRLNRNANLKDQYCKFMSEYLELNHMSPVPATEANNPVFYMPHHCVLKPESTSTKLRVVIDGSMKSSNKLSLNDILMTGPTVQEDLFSTITRFRLHNYVFTADIAKMYRQILIHEEDRKYQCILWRDSPDKEVQSFYLNTVPFGLTSAPYLATRCLNKLADDEMERFPLAAAVLKSDFYVDDVMTGSDTLENAKRLQTELIELLETAKFKLTKFCANHNDLLSHLPAEDQEDCLQINSTVKTLGLIWSPQLDEFRFNIDPAQQRIITKKCVLSELASIFDPLGFLGPVVVLGKIFMQTLWKLDVPWDTPLPTQYIERWTEYRNNLVQLNNIRIPRHILPKSTIVNLQLHNFSDSSERAYGACSYFRALDCNGIISVHLICGKSRVAPIKNTSLPRLELCAATLMAELTTRLQNIIPNKIDETFYWTDSTIVLAWISSPSYTWSTFVSNRIAKIQDVSSAHQWLHVPSPINPADVLSRGIQPNELTPTHIWFKGPEFLNYPQQFWPQKQLHLSEIPERKRVQIGLISTAPEEEFLSTINHHGSYERLLRLVSYLYRFINGTKHQNSYDIKSRTHTPEELQGALIIVVRNIQKLQFPDEYKCLQKGIAVNQQSCLNSLAPFIDDNQVIRVGGRLRNSKLSYDAKHQLLLPKKHFFTKMVFTYLHIKHGHVAPQMLLSIVRQQFWPLSGRVLARQTVHYCQRCFRCKPRSVEYFMGDLPANRVIPNRPFYVTGIDFCGPVKIHHKTRGKPPTKCYICVFVCFSTKAIHLELVGDLTTDAFLMALNRFIYRRGLCHTIVCDNATNFLGARTELKQLAELFSSKHHQNEIIKSCLSRGITWKPIPPRSPHFGGLHEAAVKSTKYHLLRIVGNACLTYEAFYTLLTQVESILNSRPLTSMSSDPNDLECLTAGHFLVGTPLCAIPEPGDPNEKVLPTARYKFLTSLFSQFWERWSKEYLNELQQRHKWSSQQSNVKLHSLVLLKEDGMPPLKWALGRIVKLYPGEDGVVRVVDVKMKNGIFRRSTVKICPLPDESSLVESTEADQH